MECPDGYLLSKQTGQCTPCAPGFLLNGDRCDRCPENHYCPSRDQSNVCEGLKSFKRQGETEWQYNPTSPPGSVYVTDCNCTASGGFLPTSIGCSACPSGTFAATGQTMCTECPVGQFSFQERLSNFYVNCSLFDNCEFDAGARQCTKCADVDANRPNTRSTGSKAQSECTRCPHEHYWDDAQSQCRPCTLPCKGPEEYQVTECTDTTNRACNVCDLGTEFLCQDGFYNTGQCDVRAASFCLNNVACRLTFSARGNR